MAASASPPPLTHPPAPTPYLMTSPPPPAPIAPPFPVILSTFLLGLPPGTCVPPHIYSMLMELSDKRSAFVTEMEKNGIGKMHKGFQADSRTFLHLWRLETQASLRDGGIDAAERQQDLWAMLCSRGQALEQAVADVIGLWAPPTSLRRMLRWRVRHISPIVEFLQLIVLLLGEEVLSWRTRGQWVPTSDNSVKEALVKVIDAQLSCIAYHVEHYSSCRESTQRVVTPFSKEITRSLP